MLSQGSKADQTYGAYSYAYEMSKFEDGAWRDPASIYTASLPIVVSNLSPFSVQLVGYGEHGGMVEVLYRGRPKDLEGVLMEVTLSQDGSVRETQRAELREGRYLAEMVDAMYELGEIDVTLTVGGATLNSGLETTVQQTVMYDHLFAFLAPIFRQRDFSNQPLGIDEYHHNDDGSLWYAKDFCLGSCQGPESTVGEGTPVYMPFSFQLLRVRAMSDICQPVVNYNIWVRHPYTGLHCVLQHMQPGEVIRTLAGNSELNDFGWGYPSPEAPIVTLDGNRVLATWGPKDGCSSRPHLHLECQNPYSFPTCTDGFFGYCHGPERYAFCPDGAPCESTPNIEMNDVLVSSWIE
jgi:hypothetical protein